MHERIEEIAEENDDVLSKLSDFIRSGCPNNLTGIAKNGETLFQIKDNKITMSCLDLNRLLIYEYGKGEKNKEAEKEDEKEDALDEKYNLGYENGYEDGYDEGYQDAKTEY